MADVHGTTAHDFIHVLGDGFTPPAGYNEITQATNGDDDIDAKNGQDIVHGGGGIDTIYGGNNNDRLSGEADADFLTGGDGADRLYGGANEDTAQYNDSNAAVRIDLSLDEVIGVGGDAQGDRLFGIEHLTGTEHFDDVLHGDRLRNILQGLGGNDALVGGAGVDNLMGGRGDDVLNGGADIDDLDGGDDIDTAYYLDSRDGVNVDLKLGVGHFGDAEGDTYKNIENIVGSGDADVLFGDGKVNAIAGFGGNDTLGGGGAADTLNGGNGKDTITYDGHTGVHVDLKAGEGVDGDAEGDVYIDIENVIGTVEIDVIVGNKKANGITGSAGRDDLTGGGGADTFIYHDIDDSPVVFGDTIRDFSSADGDRIDLSDIDANPGAPGDQDFFIVAGPGFDGIPGELLIIDDGHTKRIQGNTDGDPSAEFEIIFTNGLPTSADIDL